MPGNGNHRQHQGQADAGMGRWEIPGTTTRHAARSGVDLTEIDRRAVRSAHERASGAVSTARATLWIHHVHVTDLRFRPHPHGTLR